MSTPVHRSWINPTRPPASWLAPPSERPSASYDLARRKGGPIDRSARALELLITRGLCHIHCIGTAVEATMFAPPVAKAKPAGTLTAGRKAPPVAHEALRSQRQASDAATRASAPTASWNFAAIRVHSPSSAATSPTQTRPFTATLRALVKGRQSDALSADRHTAR